MNLPKNLRVLPGVKQDHLGRLYQLARYPSGKLVEVPYADTGAEPARMIPVYVEPVKQRRTLTAKRNLTKRETFVRYRLQGTKEVKAVAFIGELAHFHPLCISPDLGKTWKRIETGYADFYNCWHEDVKEVVA